jgi:hypothetical protein
MKKITRIAVAGAKDKGGAGLSTIAAAMATVMRATGAGSFDVHVIDADGFNQSLTQRLAERDSTGRVLAHQNPLTGVAKADLFARDGAAPIFEAIESDARVVIVDTPAGGLTQINQLSENLSARDLVRHCLDNDRVPLVIVPFNPTVATIRGIGTALDTFGPDAQVIAARSMVGIKPQDYRLWSTEPVVDQYGRTVGGQVRRRFEEAGGRVVDVPTLAAGANALAEALTLTYGQAARYNGPGWQSYDRLNVASWLGAWMRELQGIADLLGLENADWRAF